MTGADDPWSLAHLAETRDALLAALEQDQLVVHYQPIVSLADRTLDSVEALVRWQHPERGLLAPGEFLPDVSRLGLSAALDLWVIDRALSDHAGWQRVGVVGLPGCVNVNLSRQTLARADLYDRVTAALARHGVAARHLRLELVEDTDVALLARAQDQLAALRSDGVELTWDDMGAGSSSLRQVTLLPADGLKIDRAFVADMETSPSAREVVRMLIQLADAIGLHVTAEGVETAAQLELLTDLGAGQAQGFFLSAPCPVDAYPSLFASWAPPETAGAS